MERPHRVLAERDPRPPDRQREDHATIAVLQASRQLDQKYIADLQRHILEGKPPPPPAPPPLPQREQQPFTD